LLELDSAPPQAQGPVRVWAREAALDLVPVSVQALVPVVLPQRAQGFAIVVAKEAPGALGIPP
jgi:hypothetical protein